jgi:hypothetical protein
VINLDGVPEQEVEANSDDDVEICCEECGRICRGVQTIAAHKDL